MFKLIKKVFKDITVLFVNFPHWVVSKFIISVFSYVIGIVLSLPFFVIVAVLIFMSPVDWGLIISVLVNPTLSIDFNTISSVLENLYSSIAIVLLFILAVAVFIIGLSYGRVLLFNLNVSYLKGEKLGYLKNRYFDLGFIFKYIKILGLSFLILLTPIIVFILGMIVLFLIFGASKEIIVYSPFNILSFSLFLVCLLSFIILVFRLTFSYIILCDKDKKEKASYYIKKSFKLTRGFKKLFSFILLCLLVGLVIFPLELTSSLIGDRQTRIKHYVYYTNGESVGDEYYEDDLEMEFSGKTTEELQSDLKWLNILSVLYFMFNFFVLYGIYQMVFVSFYMRALKVENHDKEDENNKK